MMIAGNIHNKSYINGDKAYFFRDEPGKYFHKSSYSEWVIMHRIQLDVSFMDSSCK